MKGKELFKKKKDTEKEEFFDAPLFEYIQPQGGITFKEPNYILTGDGYIKVIHIYQMPSMLDDYWLSKICNIDGTVATIDIATRDKNEVKKNINRSLQEEFAREQAATDYQELYDARKRQEELTSMYDEINSMGEVVKIVQFRIFVPGRSLVEVEEKTDKIIKNLEGDDYRASVFLNEGKREWESLWQPYSVQEEKTYFYARGHSLMSEQVAGGNPFYYSSLNDPYGSFLGFTPMGGPVIFDMFAKTATRNYAHGLFIGKPRSGKSTSLKKQFRVRAERGDFIRCFDPVGEFEPITKEFGGRILFYIEILNPLEILKAGETDKENFARHISKLNTFFKCMNQDADASLLNDFQINLISFYESLGFIPEETRLTDLPADKYPIFSDFDVYLEKRIDKLNKKDAKGMEGELDKEKVKALHEIRKTVRKIIETYGYLFNGHTTIDNLTDEKIVTINLSTVKNLEKEVFMAYLFNMNSLCWDNCVANGSVMKAMNDRGEISYEDATKFCIIIDESHNWINASMPMIVELITKYMREAPKFFGGILMASHSIRDYFPEGTDSDVEKMKTLFELTQYKFLFLQDSSALNMIDKVLGPALTLSQRSAVTMLERGECVLVISGDRNINFKVWLSEDYEEELFSGGN